MKRTPIKLICAVQNTKTNGEDLALTPYIFLVNSGVYNSLTIGIGICWIHYAIAFGIGFNLPKQFPNFRVANNKKNEQSK